MPSAAASPVDGRRAGRRGRRAARSRAAPERGLAERATGGAVAHRRHRAGHQPVALRASGGEMLLQALSPTAARLRSRSWPSTAARAWPTSSAACGTATPPAARPGNGLGAVRRLSDEFDVHSTPGAGTVVCWPRSARRPHAGASPRVPLGRGLDAGARRDGVRRYLARAPNRDGAIAVMVADGLGPRAAGRGGRRARGCGRSTAARFAEPGRVLRGGAPRAWPAPAGRRVALAHVAGRRRALRRRRQHRRLARGAGRDGRGLVSATTAPSGSRCARSRSSSYPWPDGGMLVMHSDGLQTRWSLDATTPACCGATRRSSPACCTGTSRAAATTPPWSWSATRAAS